MNSFRTEKGTELPLLSMKGKPYLQVAHRLIWFNEDVRRFNIHTEFLKLEKDEAIVRATVQIFDDAGNLIKTATATKREDAKGFPDFHEKAETGAIGRCLALLSYGTQFATQDLDEGERLADSPVTPAKKASVVSLAPATPPASTASATVELAKLASEPANPTAVRPTFRRGVPIAATPAQPASTPPKDNF
jgi:hypothetical protein